MGSTVVLAFESNAFTWLVKPGEKVKMGQPLGIIRHSPEVDALCEGYGESDTQSEWSCDSSVEGDVECDSSVDEVDEMGMETIEIESNSNYRMEEVQDSGDSDHSGFSVFRMRSIRQLLRSNSSKRY